MKNDFTINIYHHNADSSKILDSLLLILKHLKKMDNTIDEVLTEVQEASTVEDGLITLTQGIKAALDKVLAGALPPATQAKVDAIWQGLADNKAKVAQAIIDNTPAAEEPPVE